ncbi:MAG: MOSC domain-containing protein, partial [Pseudomonadota bacterium]
MGEMSNAGKIGALTTYPIKSFDGLAHDQITVAAYEALPGDRRYAIAPGPLDGEPSHIKPGHIKKAKLLNLARHGDMARWRLEGSGTAMRAIVGDSSFAIPDEGGALAAAACAALGIEDADPHWIDMGEKHCADVETPLLSIMNSASLDAIADEMGFAPEAERFRANVSLDGFPALAEQSWAGLTMKLGEVTIRVIEPIVRCAAVSVVPGLGSVPENLVKRIYARTKTTCFGVYAEVLVGGTLKVG